MAEEIPPPPPVPRSAPRTAPTAIWSLVLAVVSFFCGWLFTAIPAVICGHVARSKIRKSGGALGGMGIATAGLILGYIALVLGVMGIPLLVSMIQSARSCAGQPHRNTRPSPELIKTTSPWPPNVGAVVPNSGVQRDEFASAQSAVSSGYAYKSEGHRCH